jgi:hypothetical protein
MSDARAHSTKVVCVVRGSLPARTTPEDARPDEPGLEAFAIHLPCADEPAEHPADVVAVAMAWFHGPPDPTAPQRWFPDARVDTYVVEEHVRIDYARDWPDGIESPGVRRISFVQSAPGLSRSEMARHWGEVHWPIARVHHPALWRYVQNVVVERFTSDAPVVDGIAELHFRAIADLRDRFYDSDEGRQIVAHDVSEFLDRGAGWRVLARETWLRS